uniref:hypothetical protein n=1 Tax=Escherichia coli TaxID=562 RepID=UPI00398500DA
GVPELKKQLDLNDAVPEISGTILFREDYLNKPQAKINQTQRARSTNCTIFS